LLSSIRWRLCSEKLYMSLLLSLQPWYNNINFFSVLLYIHCVCVSLAVVCDVYVCTYVCARRLSKRDGPERFPKPPGDKRASGSTGGVYFFFTEFYFGIDKGGRQYRTTAQRPSHPSKYGHRCGNIGQIISQNEIIIFRLLLFRRRCFVVVSKAIIAWPGRWSAFDRSKSLRIFLLFSFRHLSR